MCDFFVTYYTTHSGRFPDNLNPICHKHSYKHMIFMRYFQSLNLQNLTSDLFFIRKLDFPSLNSMHPTQDPKKVYSKKFLRLSTMKHWSILWVCMYMWVHCLLLQVVKANYLDIAHKNICIHIHFYPNKILLKGMLNPFSRSIHQSICTFLRNAEVSNCCE